MSKPARDPGALESPDPKLVRALTAVPSEPGSVRGMEGGPRVPRLNPRFSRLLCELLDEWANEQDPATWTSKPNE